MFARNSRGDYNSRKAFPFVKCMQCTSIHALKEAFSAMEIPTQTPIFNTTVILWANSRAILQEKKTLPDSVSSCVVLRINF